MLAQKKQTDIRNHPSSSSSSSQDPVLSLFSTSRTNISLQKNMSFSLKRGAASSGPDSGEKRLVSFLCLCFVRAHKNPANSFFFHV